MMRAVLDIEDPLTIAPDVGADTYHQEDHCDEVHQIEKR